MKVWTKENYLKILEEDKNMAAEPGTSGANVSLSAADFKSSTGNIECVKKTR